MDWQWIAQQPAMTIDLGTPPHLRKSAAFAPRQAMQEGGGA
jgi:hypothetical protein